MSVVNAAALLASAGGEYQIQRSVRLRSSASAFLSRTPVSVGNQKTWTWSGWVKRSALGSTTLFNAQANGNNGTRQFQISFQNDSLWVHEVLLNTSATFTVSESAVRRDVSAWYHIVVAFDTTQATASNRVKLYVNGVQSTALANTNYPALNFDANVNSTVAHYSSYYVVNGGGTVVYSDQYLAEIHFIDGQALTPASFGETDTITGVWKPKRYAGTYGTNGFYLNFADNSAATATAIGKDSSGNGNNWTPTGVSVTAGATYDSMLDVPTMWADGGNGRANYPTFNPLASVQLAGQYTISGGNLNISASNVFNSHAPATQGLPTTGKFYFEYVCSNASGANRRDAVGLAKLTAGGVYLGNTNTLGYSAVDGTVNSGSTITTYATWTNGDVVGCAVDCDTGKVWFSKNGTWQAGDPAAGTSPVTTLSGISDYAPAIGGYAGGAASYTVNGSLNCGQRPFTYSPPTGFKALHTGNLPEPSIKLPNKWFDATTYAGTGAAQNIINSGAMQPDLVWAKSRSSSSYSHRLFDSSRGVNLSLQSNTTNGDTSEANSLTAFNSNGFSLGADAAGGGVNTNAVTYVAWQWKEGATPGFDIVTFTGDGVNGRAISHSLGVAPKLIFVKNRSAATNWLAYTTLVDGSPDYLILNLTDAKADSTVPAPDSSQFYVSSFQSANGNGNSMVAYAFAEVPGFSKFGRYVGNGSTDGPFVYCGFRPKYVLIKQTNTAANWNAMDGTRSTYNEVALSQQVNTSAAEESGFANEDLLSNGFKLRTTNATWNANGGTYIFAAFAENPFKYALAR